MNSKLLFIGGCIPARIFLAILALRLKTDYLPILGWILIGIGLSFIYLYTAGLRLNAPEANGNTWWKDYRPIHGCLYLAAGLYCLKKDRKSAALLAIDITFGITVFVSHRYLS